MRTFSLRTWLFWVFLIFLLSSCSQSQDWTTSWSWETVNSGAKSPFIVQTLRIWTSSIKNQVEKSARIVSSSNLTLTAQSAWEVAKILVKEWQSVKAWATLINIRDSLTNLDLRLEQAENALEIQEAGMDTTKANLDISVENARIAYEKAKQAYNTLISKNEIQYDTLVNTNGKLIDSYSSNYATYLGDIERSMSVMIFEWDKILGVSTDFDSANDSWEPYLWVRTGDTKLLAKNAWNKVYASRWLIRARLEKWSKLDPQKANEDITLLTESFDSLRKYADAMVYMIQNNVVGWGLPQNMQDGWVAAWNAYRSQVQWSEAQFNSWKSQVASFLKTYSDSETATKLALASLTRELTQEEQNLIGSSVETNLSFKNAQIDLQDKMKTMKLSLEQTEVSYKNARILHDATLRQLLASKRSTEISLEQAKRDYAKLRITAPVDATITRILTSVWQTVSTGTPTLEISWKIPEILLDIDDTLAKSLETGMSVWVEVDGITLSGTITAVSKVSSNNLLSSLRIGIPNGGKYIGKSVIVKLTPGTNEMTINNNILPLDAVHIISEWEGEINVLTSSGEVIKKVVKIGSTEWSGIEVLTKLEENTQIILSDMSNFDPIKHTITVQ